MLALRRLVSGIASASALALPLQALAEKLPLTIAHTNDLHSHLEGTGPDSLLTPETDGDPVRGGFARLATMISTERQRREASQEGFLLFDAGDFFSGTLFHALGASEIIPATPELEFFHYCHYDAITLGNHEFDAGLATLGRMIGKGKAQGFAVPILASNILKVAPGQEIGVVKYITKNVPTKGRILKALVVGLFPPDAALLSASSRNQEIAFVGFNDEKVKKEEKSFLAHAAKVLGELESSEKPDLSIALFHGGREEASRLAKAVPTLDLIVGGHTHEREREVFGSTIYAQTGAMGENLGLLELAFDTDSRHLELRTPNSPSVLPVDDSWPADPGFQSRINTFKGLVKNALGTQKFEYDTPIFSVTRDQGPTPVSRDPFSRRMASHVLNGIHRETHEPVNIYFTAAGMVRDGFRTAGLPSAIMQLSDVFRVFGTGFDKSHRPGAPLLSFHLTKGDLRLLLEFLEIYGEWNPTARPVTSENLSYEIRGWGIPLVNRLRDLTLDGKPFDQWPSLVSVAMNEFVAGYLPKLRAMSRGIVNVQPRDARGNPISELPPLAVGKEYELLAESLRAAGASNP